jgi:hypothetical protein
MADGFRAPPFAGGDLQADQFRDHALASLSVGRHRNVVPASAMRQQPEVESDLLGGAFRPPKPCGAYIPA